MASSPHRSPRFITAHWAHHWRFYASVAVGVVVFLLADKMEGAARLAAAADAFFVVYLAGSVLLISRLTMVRLKQRATIEDEGILIVIVIALAVIAVCIVGIFTVLNQKQRPDAVMLGLSVASAPLGWFTLHAIAAFHYAYLYYAGAGTTRTGGTVPLQFPGKGEPPGTWDFLYYAFVVGMTAQVSDVQVLTTAMRRVTLGHSVISFFFNTVLIAMAVNAVVAIAS